MMSAFWLFNDNVIAINKKAFDLGFEAGEKLKNIC